MPTETDLVTPSASAFDYRPRTRMIFGVGCVEQVGQLASELAAKRVLLVTDPGIVRAGHADRVTTILKQHHISVVCFDRVEENPGTRCVASCVELARASAI